MGLDPKIQPLKFTMYADYHIAIPYAMISTYIKHFCITSYSCISIAIVGII